MEFKPTNRTKKLNSELVCIVVMASKHSGGVGFTCGQPRKTVHAARY